MRTTASRDTFAWRDAGLPREIAIVCGAKRKGRVIEMLVSTKGRYALRLMVCVAQAGAEGKVALREVSEREDISLKYLEQLARPLVQAGCFAACAARAAATRWHRSRPLSGRATCCARWKAPRLRWRALIARGDGLPASGRMHYRAFWAGLDEVIERYVDGVTLADLAGEPRLAVPSCNLRGYDEALTG